MTIKSKFRKDTKEVVKDPLLREFENDYFTTPTSKWKEYDRGFKLQLPEDTEDNRIRGSHVPEILDSIFEVLKWILYRHNEVTVLRYDFYPADSDISISDFHNSLTKKLGRLRRFKDKTISTLKPDKGNAIFKDLKYFWVREKGTHEAGGGIHYHCFAVFRTPDRMTQKQINDTFRDRAAKSLKGLIKSKLTKGDFTNRKRKKKLLETYVEKIAPFKLTNSKDKPNCPYVTIPGYFWLKRDMLALDKSELQRQHLIAALEKLEDKTKPNEGHKYLRLDVIAKRIHSKEEPIGGILQECIYALSYIAKTVTKHALPDNKKMCGMSKLVDKGIIDKRKHQIANSTTEVNHYFKEYEKHGLEMQTKRAI
ncbi:MAG: inovirus Gp2 family protein [Gammaproteobacteria bacterium]|nr:inovirus Gp2 family protein [Gammaproteobacteria bacterium]